MFRTVSPPVRLAGVAFAFIALAAAHDLYLLPSSFHVHKGETLRVYLHNGDAFPLSEAPPVLARLKSARLLGKSGSSDVTDLRIAGNEAVGSVVAPGSGSLWLSVETTPNLIQLPADKFLAYLKEEGLHKIVAWRAEHGETEKSGRERYRKFAKSLLQSESPSDFYRQPLGFPIEIVPLANPSGIHAGEVLPVRVLFRSEPAVGFQVEAAWSDGNESKIIIAGQTDNQGKIDIPIAKAGKWRLHSLGMERCREPKTADWESFWASLTFEIAS